MSLCVAGITGLQLFWNYQNYRNTVKTFNHDINDALNTAVNKEIDQRQQKIISVFKQWLADTSFVMITCNIDNRNSITAFHIMDSHPYLKGEKGITLSFIDFKEKLKQITPSAKAYFIERFSNTRLRSDLINGDVYYYTQRLGDSLSNIYAKSKLNTVSLCELYKAELSLKGINTSFNLTKAASNNSNLFLTNQVNAALRRPYQKELIQAAFQSPGVYFIKEMKWIIISSFLLIAITITCFAYTLKTLLSQHKLAELKDDFINNMTHEINTPVSSIKITTEALKTFDLDQRTRKEYLDIISYQAEKLTTLTEQILNISKLGQVKTESNTRIELNKLIRNAIYDIGPLDNDRIINFQPVHQEIYIWGDASSILNSFINIIDNALKYNEGIASVDIKLSSNKNTVEVIFTDNGIGIPVEYRDKIFDKFFRVPKGNTHDVKGYGLGLNYVKQTIEQHRGSIAVRANVSCGSIFTIRLPLI